MSFFKLVVKSSCLSGVKNISNVFTTFFKASLLLTKRGKILIAPNYLKDIDAPLIFLAQNISVGDFLETAQRLRFVQLWKRLAEKRLNLQEKFNLKIQTISSVLSSFSIIYFPSTTSPNQSQIFFWSILAHILSSSFDRKKWLAFPVNSFW